MPRKVSQAKPPEFGLGSVQPHRASPKDDWGGFVPVELAAVDRESFIIWQSDNAETIWSELDDCLGRGFKHSVSFDQVNQCYVASLSGRPSAVKECSLNCVLTGRGGTYVEAVAVLLYKHVEILRRDWLEVLDAPKSNRRSFG